MIHKALVVIAGDDADVADATGGHIGKGKVDLTVTATVGKGSHCTLVGQFAYGAVINIGENNAH